MTILTITPLTCTPEFYNELCSIFPIKQPVPEDSISSIMYRAGQASVLNYIKQLITNTEVSSDMKKLVKPASYMNRKIKQ